MELIVTENCVAACKGAKAIPIPNIVKWFVTDLNQEFIEQFENMSFVGYVIRIFF